METGIIDKLHFTCPDSEARAMNPVTLALIGDAVFSDYIRRYLLACGLRNVNHLTKESIRYVRASAQATMVHALWDTLTDTEQTIVRRGRNTRSHVPKNAKVIDYRYATGFEALLGYLDLTGQTERLETLIAMGIECLHQTNTQ